MAKPTLRMVTHFTKILVDINAELKPGEVEDLKDICIISEILPESEMPTVRNALSLFKALRTRQLISENNTYLIKDLLTNIKREDLVEKYLTTYTENTSPTVVAKCGGSQTPTSRFAENKECQPSKDNNQRDGLGDTALLDTTSPIEVVKCGGLQKKESQPLKDNSQQDGLEDIVVLSKSTPFKASKFGQNSNDTASTDTSVLSSNCHTVESVNHSKLRDYQKELAQPAIEGKNTIICAPTGCGKTITAAEICKHHYDNSPEPDKFRALFIVPMRHLTSQQRTALETHFNPKDLGALKESETLQAIIRIKKVVMITAQILVNALEKNDVQLSNFDMLIFDECHHTTLNHPYNNIMRNYLLKKKRGQCKLPFILGLSASLGVGADGDAAKHIITLCANMDVSCVSYVRKNRADLNKHVHTPENDEIRRVEPRPQGDEFRRIIEDIMLEQECKHIGTAPHEKGSQEYENWIIQHKMDSEKLHRRSETVISGYLLAFNNALILYDNTRAIDAFEYIRDYFRKRDISEEFIDEEEELRSDYESYEENLRDISKSESTKDCPKLRELTRLLQITFENERSSKGIILCRTRLVVKSLTNFLKQEKLLAKYNIKPDSLVGQGKSDKPDTMKENEQMKVLKSFKDGKINILVATDIAQEGLDLPACNLVVRFNFVSNEIGTVQSRGRARASGKCYLIVERDSRNEKHEMTNRDKVTRMKDALQNVDLKSPDEFNDEVAKQQKELIEKYEEELMAQKETLMIDKSSDVKVLCKECSEVLCYASDLRMSGSNFTCVGEEFKKKVTEIKRKSIDFRDTVTLGLIKCAKLDCGQKLGSLILFKGVTNQKGYGLSVGSLKFENPKKADVKTWTLKKWKNRTFEIKTLEI